MELAAASLQKLAFSFHRDFVESFQTVGRKTGANGVNPLDTGLSEFNECLCGVRLEPFSAPEARLERDLILVRSEIQRLGQQPAGLLALALVRIAFL